MARPGEAAEDHPLGDLLHGAGMNDEIHADFRAAPAKVAHRPEDVPQRRRRVEHQRREGGDERMDDVSEHGRKGGDYPVNATLKHLEWTLRANLARSQPA